ncbi:ribonuclease E activity regulator RraA [Siminovitchia sediminis]|uniref:4-hydroxy-4-methyl-2-oxoglutarate aldolase n=1 Tax=Siminovitchia sediminis TaxID=1274353 RepID=A0ABW4KI90_9BACI
MKTFKTADLCDDHSEQLQICSTVFQSYGKRTRFYGKIETVKVLEDNVLVLEAIESVAPGSVLVVDGEGSRQCALMGDRLAGIAASRGLSGVIIHGCVRDSGALAVLDLGILAVGTHPLKSKKEGKGERDTLLNFGGVTWRPGEYVYADRDGVVISKDPLL